VAETSVALELTGESLLLHAERALIWPARRTLFIADLCLGKDEVFRQSGIATPEGGTMGDLRRIDRLVAAHALTSIVLLGDFLHAAPRSAPRYLQTFSEWRQSHGALEFIVVAGNQDRRAAGRELVDVVQWHVNDWQVGPFVCRHRPAVSSEGYVLSGHLHPVFKLSGSVRERARVPVCWVQPGCAVLPSFGSFTGGGDIEPAGEDELYAFAGDRVWRLPRRA
jgi:DNA ligase-associated metallophosphoesterase